MRGRSAIVIAFDFGVRRIGVATGNLHTRTATPIATLSRGADDPWQDIDRLVAEWRPELLVVGLPASTRPQSIVRDIERFVAALRERYELDVATVDESLTSEAARSGLRSARRAGYLRRRVGKRGLVDRHAACLIAEQWLTTDHCA